MNQIVLTTKQIIVIAVVIVTVFFVLGGVIYWLQSARVENIRMELRKELEGLKEEIGEPPTIKAIASVPEEAEKEPVPEGVSIRVIAPNGGESLCLGNSFNIKWESKGLRAVTISIKEAGSGTSYPLGSFPATFNESGEEGNGLVVWKIGDTPGGVKLAEGFAYEIIINATTNGSSFSDKSDGLFSILRCEG